jgi:hypothetical protein
LVIRSGTEWNTPRRKLISAMRRVAREVLGAAEVIAATATGYDYGRSGKPTIDWDDPAANDALVSALVNDANAVVAVLADADLPERAAQALALLALVAGQDVEPAQGSDGTDRRWRIARKVAEDRVLSTVDPRARHTRKSPEHRRDGYRAHVAAEPETGLITDERLTKAAGIDNSDPAVAEQFLDREGEPCTWYGDSAYGTGDLRGAINDAEHQAVIKPKPLPAPVPGGFTIDDFTVDETAGTVTCPAGNTRPISRTRVATFGALCRDCPLRQRCTKSNTGRKIILRDRDDLLRQARRDWVANPALRDNSGTWASPLSVETSPLLLWRCLHAKRGSPESQSHRTEGQNSDRPHQGQNSPAADNARQASVHHDVLGFEVSRQRLAGFHPAHRRGVRRAARGRREPQVYLAYSLVGLNLGLMRSMPGTGVRRAHQRMERPSPWWPTFPAPPNMIILDVAEAGARASGPPGQADAMQRSAWAVWAVWRE